MQGLNKSKHKSSCIMKQTFAFSRLIHEGGGRVDGMAWDMREENGEKYFNLMVASVSLLFIGSCELFESLDDHSAYSYTF